MCPMTSRRAFVTAAVRGVAFALVTALFTAVPLFHGYLWCVYIGFFLTMAFGVKLPEYPNYLCSLLVAMSGHSPTSSATSGWRTGSPCPPCWRCPCPSWC